PSVETTSNPVTEVEEPVTNLEELNVEPVQEEEKIDTPPVVNTNTRVREILEELKKELTQLSGTISHQESLIKKSEATIEELKKKKDSLREQLNLLDKEIVEEEAFIKKAISKIEPLKVDYIEGSK